MQSQHGYRGYTGGGDPGPLHLCDCLSCQTSQIYTSNGIRLVGLNGTFNANRPWPYRAMSNSIRLYEEGPGMESSRTVLDLEDTSRTKIRGLGLGLGLDAVWPWPWPWPRGCLALALALTSNMPNLNMPNLYKVCTLTACFLEV